MDFVQLCKDAYPDGTVAENSAPLEALWRAAFSLEYWYFPLPPNREENSLQPLLMKQENEKLWAFAFTDLEKLREFCVVNNIYPDEESVVFVGMKVDSVPDWTLKLIPYGLEIIHFNYGFPGWSVSADNLPKLFEFVVNGVQPNEEGAES